MKDLIEALIEALPEQYQDVRYGAGTLRGKRDCSARWRLIEPSIRPHDVVMDLGSSLGYYSHRIAKGNPGSLTVSFESEPGMCAVQKEIFRSEGIYNVVVCQHRLSRADLEKWVKHVDCFDVVLALSVLHHFPAGDVEDVFDHLMELSGEVVGEIPPEGEREVACGGEAAARIGSALVRKSVTYVHLGEVPSHLGDYRRKIWMTHLPYLTRSGLEGYFGVSHGGRHKFLLSRRWPSPWLLNARGMIGGINVWNLLHFNVVWPPSAWWRAQARAAYECLEFKSDVRPWNLLITPTGLKAIDHTHVYPEGDQAEYGPGDLERLDIVFSEMKPIKEGIWS